MAVQSAARSAVKESLDLWLQFILQFAKSLANIITGMVFLIIASLIPHQISAIIADIVGLPFPDFGGVLQTIASPLFVLYFIIGALAWAAAFEFVARPYGWFENLDADDSENPFEDSEGLEKEVKETTLSAVVTIYLTLAVAVPALLGIALLNTVGQEAAIVVAFLVVAWPMYELHSSVTSENPTLLFALAVMAVSFIIPILFIIGAFGYVIQMGRSLIQDARVVTMTLCEALSDYQFQSVSLIDMVLAGLRRPWFGR